MTTTISDYDPGARPRPGPGQSPEAARGPAGPPLAVWACGQRSLAAQLHGRYLPATARHQPLTTPDLAAAVITAFTSRGDLVADPAAGPGTVLAEAAAAGRHAAGMTAAPDPGRLARANLDRVLSPARRRLARIWDDDGQPLASRAGHGTARLVLTRLPGPGSATEASPAGTAARLGRLNGTAYQRGLDWFLGICAGLTAPGGTCAIITTSPVRRGRLTDLPGMVIVAAARHGLDWTQHVIALTAQIHDSRLIAWAPDGEHGPAGMTRDYEDLLIFTRPAACPSPPASPAAAEAVEEAR